MGTVPHQDVESKECELLPAGEFGDGVKCPVNTYSDEGAAECTACPHGKYSNTAASRCIECDFMYNLSTHCEVPYTGALLIVGALIIVVVVSLLFRRYKKKQDRIKEKLRFDLYRQKQLVKTKQTDIKLMTGAWKLSPKEVKLEENIASGAYGEVWKGALHDRWIVAIKKLFPQSGSSSNVSSVSKRPSVSKKRNSLERTSASKLFKDQEIRFLIRTWCSSA